MRRKKVTLQFSILKKCPILMAQVIQVRVYKSEKCELISLKFDSDISGIMSNR